MADFYNFCRQFSPLEEEALAQLIQSSTTKTFQKGVCLLKKGDVCKHLFFINEGLAKISFHKGGKEFITRFFKENVLFSVFESYLTQTSSRFMIVALEPTGVTLISRDVMESLCKRHHCMETFFGKLLSIATVKMTKRISAMMEEDATHLYNQFVEDNYDILQRITLGELANYLGITRQSLSRIRAQR